MIDFLVESRAPGGDGSGMAPQVYIELVLLPRQGWPKSEQARLSLAERHMLRELYGLEAKYGNR